MYPTYKSLPPPHHEVSGFLQVAIQSRTQFVSHDENVLFHQNICMSIQTLRTLSFLTAFIFYGFLCVSQQTYTAKLTGYQETAPVLTEASGNITATLTGNVLVVSGQFQNLSGPVAPIAVTGTHIHTGLTGQDGGVELSLVPTLALDSLSGTFQGLTNTFTLTTAQLVALQQRGLYVNIHTMTHPQGEIRGQLLPEQSNTRYYMAELTGSSEFPVVYTSGGGKVLVEQNGNQITLTGSFNGLEGDFDATIGGGVHLHLGLPGQNGGIEIPLQATVDATMKSGVFLSDSNTYILTTNQRIALEKRNLYINIHTTLHPSGEIRGQVMGLAQAIFRAHLSGAQAVPSTQSSARGQLVAELDGSNLVVIGAFRALDSDYDPGIGAHFHQAMAGRTGGVELPLNTQTTANLREGQYLADSNTFNLTGSQVEALIARALYANIHTVDHPSGEIRGQMVPMKQMYFVADISGAQTIPHVNTQSRGRLLLEVQNETVVTTGSFTNLGSDLDLSIANGVHLHSGQVGQTGSILQGLNAMTAISLEQGIFMAHENTYSLTAADIAAFRAREVYVNVHTLDHASGAARGQVAAEAEAYYYAPLSASAQTPAINSMARGALFAESNNGKLTVYGSFGNLSSAMDTSIAGGAHLHTGLAGESGPVTFVLAGDLDASLQAGNYLPENNQFTMSAPEKASLKARELYANLHSTNYAAGELRAQLLPAADQYYRTHLSGFNQPIPVATNASGAAVLELSGESVVASGSFTNLSAALDTSIAGGVHLHNAGVGNNGIVSVVLAVSTDANLLNGTVVAAGNQFQLMPVEVEAMTQGELYANVHTLNHPTGEIRGQVLPSPNYFPDVPGVQLPAAGTLVDVTIGNTLDVIFTNTSDPDGNEIVYHWQVAATDSFADPLLTTEASRMANADVAFNRIDTLLAGIGVAEGDTITVYHRALAGDGSLLSAGAALEMTLVRGTSTDIAVAENRSWTIYPNPTSAKATLAVEGVEGSGHIRLINISGRVVYQRNLQWSDNQLITLPVQDLSSGIYLVELQGDNWQATETLQVQ